MAQRQDSDARLRARYAALVRASQESGTEMTAPARKAFLDRFEREVDPDGTLPPDERARRADAARRAHMTKLAMKSARARRKD